MRKREVIEEKIAKTCQYCEGAILEVLLDIRDELVELRKELIERDMERFVKEVRRGMEGGNKK